MTHGAVPQMATGDLESEDKRSHYLELPYIALPQMATGGWCQKVEVSQ